MFNVTVEEFKAQFPRFSPMYLPVYILGNTYFKGDIVFYNNLFYQCTAENTVNSPDNTDDWVIYNDSTLNYTRDEDIQEAMQEAGINFNKDLFECCNQAKTAFLMLVAHYLTVDFNNAMGNNQVGIMTSKSVGSVSQGYSIPNWLSSNPALSAYATTGYGVKYATLIQPYLCGQIILSKGKVTYD
jgi:hypothetical protein